MRGVPLRVVQELLGHSTIQMTMRYAHLAPEVTRDAVNLMDRPNARTDDNYAHVRGSVVAASELHGQAGPACSSRRSCMQLGAYRFPGDIVVGVRQRLTRAPLDLAGPRCFHVGLGLAV